MITGFIPMESLVAFADSINKPFSITNTSFSYEGATLSWKYNYEEGSETNFELDTNLELEEEAVGNLISEGKEIGTYTISTDGELQIEINEEDVKNIMKEESQDVVLPNENSEITTDESVSVEVEESSNIPTEKTFTGSFEVSGAKEKQNEEPTFSLFGDFSLFGEPVAGIPDTVIHTVIAKNQANGTEIQDIAEYRPQIGDEIWLEIMFTLEAGHMYPSGSTLSYELPEPLIAAGGSGNLSEDGVAYATYTVTGGKVVITFNDNIRQYNSGGEDIGGLKVDGYFGITAKFESSDTDINQDLVLPDKDEAEGSITIPIKFKPVEGKILDKKVVTPEPYNNLKEIDWKIDVNTSMNDLGAGKTFADSLENTNHKYKAGSLKVTSYKLAPDGVTRVNEEDVTTSFSQLTDAQGNFSLNLSGEFAYEIIYKTIPGDTDDASQTVKNKASFPGATSITKNVTINYGKPLEKKGTKTTPTGTTAWTITVNANEKTIASGTQITDTWSVGHILDGNISVSGLSAGDYTISNSTEGFILTLNREVTEKFDITYKTKLADPNNVISKDIPITNEVIRSDRTDNVNDRKKTIQYNQNVISKTNSNINYQNKTVDWTLTINSANYNMKDIVISDSFVNKNLKIKDGTFVVKKGSSVLDPYADYTLEFGEFDSTLGTFTEGNLKGGFRLTIPNETGLQGIYTITYTTDYDIKDESTPGDIRYLNEAKFKWLTNAAEYTSQKVSSEVIINTQQKENGYKGGSYNYEEKKFYWQVGFNYNFDTVAVPVLKDVLPTSQIIDSSSIKVYHLDLSSGGNGVVTGPVLVDGVDYDLTFIPDNQFEIKFKASINSPYRVEYTSTTKHDYYMPQATNHKVKNEAEFLNDTIRRGHWEKELEVKHSKDLITKAPTQDGNSAVVEWTLNLNWSQSTIKNAVITDTVGKDSEGNLNQLLYKDSFKLVEMNFSGENATPTEGTVHKAGEDLFDIVFSDGSTDPTFTITFKQTLTKAYKLVYRSYFLGASGSNIENTATLSYAHNSDDSSGESTGSNQKAYNASFSYFGGAFTHKGIVKVTKEDVDDSGKKLSGAVFQLWNKATDGVLIEEISQDEDGVYTFSMKLGYGDYYLVEKTAPAFYDLNSSEYKDRKKITIDESIENIVVKNKKFKQAVQLTKVAEHDSDLALESVVYKLEKEMSGTFNPVAGYDRLVTNSNGKIYIDELTSGNYRLIEIETLPLYSLDSTPINFTISDGQVATIEKTATNAKLGDLVVKKLDKADKSSLEGAQFTLTDTTNSAHSYISNTTLSDGIASFTGVKYGTYKLTETTVPDGYVGSAETVVTLSDANNTLIAGNENLVIEIENEKIYQAVKLIKNDKDDSIKKLNDAVFAIYKSSDDSKVLKDAYGSFIGDENGQFKTDINGLISVNNLEPGNYYFKEIKAPKHYLLPTSEADKKIYFQINLNQTSFSEVQATNTRGKGDLKIKKVDSADNSIFINAVEFNLLDEAGAVVANGTTNSNGDLIFQDLPYGLYKLKEVTANLNYILDTTEISVDFDGDGVDAKILDIQVENVKKDHSVKLTKYNQSQTLKLSSAKFELLNEIAGIYTKIDEYTTDSNGEIYIARLTPGKYRFVEVNPPSGYLLDKNPINFEILDNQTQTLVLSKINSLRPSGGGGGGGTPPVVPPVVPPVTPPVVPPVTPPVVPPVTPPVVPPVTPPITTPENTPIGGQVDIPDEGVPTVVVPPQNGEVTIDEDGNWVYDPNPGFVGEDSFTIVISSPDGDEEVVIDIEVEEIPLGVVTPPSEEDINGDLPTGVPVLPKTGAIDSTFYYLLGAILIFIGFKIRRR